MVNHGMDDIIYKHFGKSKLSKQHSFIHFPVYNNLIIQTKCPKYQNIYCGMID